MTGRRGDGRSAGRRFAEWVTLSVSALLLLGVVGYLTVKGFGGKDTVTLEAEPRPARRQARGWVVPVRVANRGDRAVRDVVVLLSHSGAGGREERELKLDYLAEGSEREIFVVFELDPDGLELCARPLRYRTD